MLPQIIDVHVHMTRSVAQERAVFPRADYPDEWRWANEERVGAQLDGEPLEALVAVNYMVLPDMFDQRRRRNPELPEHEIWDELRNRARDFNSWILDLHRREPRVIPFVCCDIGVWRDTDALMEELERCIGLGAKGVKMHPGLGRFFPADSRQTPISQQTKGITRGSRRCKSRIQLLKSRARLRSSSQISCSGSSGFRRRRWSNISGSTM